MSALKAQRVRGVHPPRANAVCYMSVRVGFVVAEDLEEPEPELHCQCTRRTWSKSTAPSTRPHVRTNLPTYSVFDSLLSWPLEGGSGHIDSIRLQRFQYFTLKNIRVYYEGRALQVSFLK